MKSLRIAAVPFLLALAACAAAPHRTDRTDDRARLAALERGLRPMVLEPGQAPPQWTIAERMAQLKVGKA